MSDMVQSDDGFVNPSDREESLLIKLRQRFATWRNQKVMDPAFQRFATKFILTRPLVKKKQKALFDLTAGFVYAQVLYVCVDLGVFEKLANGAMSVDELAGAISMPKEGAERLVAAATALELLQVIGGRVFLADLGAAVIANPGLGAMVKHHAMFYRDLSEPVELLRGERPDTELGQYWGYATSDKPRALKSERVDDYSALMAISQEMIADEIIEAYPLARHAQLMDVGGGEGAFVSAVAKRVPGLHVSVFDLPSVAERAKTKMADKGHGDRFTAHGGSFFDDPIPQGADIFSLIRVLYDHGDESVLKILQGIRRALPKGGTLLVAEPMADTPGAEAMGGAYFGFYLLAMQSGRSRSVAEIQRLLEKTGFSDVKRLKNKSPLLTSVMIARG